MVKVLVGEIVRLLLIELGIIEGMFVEKMRKFGFDIFEVGAGYYLGEVVMLEVRIEVGIVKRLILIKGFYSLLSILILF